ncbi:MAG: DUF2141 domain-containing protein [Bacteroidetes bacterium]|jgi:uncharacterized protein (DUF2141 family)|nr:MAG: DUF2141 domain-containing protein [Bacteroidota bacterium]
MKKLILIAISLCAIYTAQSQTVNITVTVSNVKSNKGVIKVCIFNKETGFPEKTNLSIKCVKVAAAKGVMQIKVEGIAPGNYAIAVHHDTNNDGIFNTNFFGIPIEASGASNGAKGKMGPPKYSDAVIVIDKNKTQVAISIE